MAIPRYVCHKVVEAFKIREMVWGGRAYLTLYGLDDCWVTVSYAYDAKHHPQVGGYFVRYTDGYESYSPAEAFESGYALYHPPVKE